MPYTKLQYSGIWLWGYEQNPLVEVLPYSTCVVQADLNLRRYACRKGRLGREVEGKLKPYLRLSCSNNLLERTAFNSIHEAAIQSCYMQWEESVYRGKIPPASNTWLLAHANEALIEDSSDSPGSFSDFSGAFNGFELKLFGDDVQPIYLPAFLDSERENAPVVDRIVKELGHLAEICDRP